MVPPVVPGIAGPVENVSVLPFRAEVVYAQAVVVVPGNEREIGGAHEVAFGAQRPGVIEVVVGRGRIVVVPAAEQQVDARPAQEGGHVHDGVDRLTECVGAESPVPAGKSRAVYRRDELRQVIVGAGVVVVFVGLEPVGTLVVVGTEVLTSAVVPVGVSPVFQGRASDVAAVGLVKVAMMIVTEVILQEFLVDLLNDREQAVVGRVECELRVGVPG